MVNKTYQQKKIFIGVSWPYASSNIHLGHLAGQYVTSDIFARYHRTRGNKVLMVSGSDSHGAAVELAAEEQGLEPEELAKQSHSQILDTYQKLDLLYENYTSTTTPNHKEIVQNIFLVLKEKGLLSIENSMQYYDTKAKRFLPDRYVKGTCPKCQNNNARGDECPECGEFLTPEDLKNPYSTISNTKPILKETQHYYIDLKSNTKQLDLWIESVGKNWRKWVLASTQGMIKTGLEARPITRDLKFGISVPLKGWEEKKIYVWLEAVIGYLSASIEWAQNIEEENKWEEFWKDENCKHYYFIAGGNVPFHTIIWPSELLGYNKKYLSESTFNTYPLPGEKLNKPLNLPYNIVANKMLMYKGVKMSKGDKTGITLEHLLEKYNSDLIRYFCSRYAPEAHDREFVWKDFIDANNNELVANIGNFINRTLTFLETKFENTVPEGEISEDVEKTINTAYKECSENIETCNFVKATESILNLGHFANKYFNDQAPWQDIKSNKSSAENTIYNSIQLVNAIRILIKPFMPKSAEQLSQMLNIQNEYDPNKELEIAGYITNTIDSWFFTNISSGEKLNKPEIIFQKLEYSEELRNEDEENYKEGKINKGEEKHINIDPNLEYIPIIWETFTNLKIKKRNTKVKNWIKDITEKIIEKYKHTNLEQRNIFVKYKELHGKYSKEKTSQPSAMSLVQTVLEKGSLPNINTLVDIYNAISALTGVSIGAHDIERITNDIEFKIIDKNKYFESITNQQLDIAKKGEYAYTDEDGIICRLDIKQSDRTKISEHTKSAIIILQGYEGQPKEELEKALNLLKEGIQLIQK